MSDKVQQEFCAGIEAFFGTGRCFALAKGRVGLYAALRALNLPAGAKVVVPGYTCMVVPAAVQFAGLEPVYVDIDPTTYNLDATCLSSMDMEDVGAIVVQHTYGIPADMPAILPHVRRESLRVIEDCCHAFGSTIDGKLCGLLGDAAFMSGQWNKPFSTGLGGMLLVHDEGLAEEIERLIEAEARPVGIQRRLVLQAQILAHRLLAWPRTMARLRAAYRRMGKLGLLVGSSSMEELEGGRPEDYFMRMASCQARKGLRELAAIRHNLGHRRRLSALYHRRLPEMGFVTLPSVAQGQPLLRYPVRVANKTELLERAAAERIELGSWFDAPLHPAETRQEDLGYRAGDCPQGELASKQVVNLPTHPRVTQGEAEYALAFLERHAVRTDVAPASVWSSTPEPPARTVGGSAESAAGD